MSSDEASIVSDVGDENDLEIIQEGGEEPESNLENNENQVEEGAEQNETEQQEQGDENETQTKVKPKRVIRNPQPKLNEQTLKGPRGLGAIENYFERVTFKGRGYEEQDLNVLMKTYEYWCHRLFPKFPFDDCIARLEKLGTKKATQTHIKRIRMGINFDDDKPLDDADEENENNTAGFVDTNDEFDNLLSNTTEPTPEISEEQLNRMRQNRERAEKLRQERLRQIREKAKSSLQESSQLSEGNSQAISNGNSQINKNMFGESSQSNRNVNEGSQNNGTSIDVNIVEDIFSQENEMEDNVRRENVQKGNEDDSEDDIDNILNYINTDDNVNENCTDNKTSEKVEESMEADTNSKGCVSSDEKLTNDYQTEKNAEPLENNEISSHTERSNKENFGNESGDHITSGITNEEETNDVMQRDHLENLNNKVEGSNSTTDKKFETTQDVPIKNNIASDGDNIATVDPEESMDVTDS